MTRRRTPKRTSEARRPKSRTRGQSEVLGVVLLLAITIAGTGLVVAFGSSALDDSQHASELDSAEHAMTQFDSHAAMVALGDSAVQSVSFGQSGGDYSVHSDAGTIEITHVNYNGTDNHTVLNETSLGSVIYENDGTTIAYQGGGVWRKGESGASRMVSPPEFHYQSATLTLPIIRVKGSGGAAGSPTGSITEVARADPIYPTSEKYPDDTPYENPLSSGKMVVTIQSEYYEAWADYFRSRTSGNVTVNHSTDPGTVTVDLVSTGTRGAFNMPNDGSGVEVRGVEEDHKGEENDYEYVITLQPDDTDSADFSNLEWSMYAERDDRQLEVHLRHQGGKDCDGTDVSATVYYSEDGGDTYQGWYDKTAYTTECFDADGDGEEDEVRLVAGLIDDDSTDPELTYGELSSSKLTHFSLSGADLNSSPVFNEHTGDFTRSDPDDSGEEYSKDSKENIDFLLKHYFALMGPRFDLTVDDKNSDSVNEGVSSGTIDYPGSDKFVTYLHITENEVKVELN